MLLLYFTFFFLKMLIPAAMTITAETMEVTINLEICPVSLAVREYNPVVGKYFAIIFAVSLISEKITKQNGARSIAKAATMESTVDLECL